MFVMLLDVHKWVAMPAVAARVRQAGNTADPSTLKGDASHLPHGILVWVLHNEPTTRPSQSQKSHRTSQVDKGCRVLECPNVVVHVLHSVSPVMLSWSVILCTSRTTWVFRELSADGAA